MRLDEIPSFFEGVFGVADGNPPLFDAQIFFASEPERGESAQAGDDLNRAPAAASRDQPVDQQGEPGAERREAQPVRAGGVGVPGWDGLGDKLDAAVGRPRDGLAALGAIFTAQLRITVTGRLAGTSLAAHAHAIAAGFGGAKSSGAQSGLTAAARQALATAARAGFADSLNTILLIGAAVAAVTSLTLIRGRDFAAIPAAPETQAGYPASAEPVTT